LDDTSAQGTLALQERGRASLGEALAVFAACFIADRTLVAWLGLDTLADVLEKHWQFLDLARLDAHPLGSLWQLHAQPPLLNALAWLLGRMPGDRYEDFIHLNALCTAVTGMLLYIVALRESRQRWLARLVTAAYVLSPAVLLNTAYPFYPTLTAMGYAVVAYALSIVSERPKRSFALTVGAFMFLALLRSSFTPLHALAILAVFLACATPKPKLGMCGWIIALGVAVTLITPVKNLLAYHAFVASSWSTLNLAKGFGIETGDGDFFPRPDVIRERHPELTCPYSYGDQDRPDFKSNGEPNYNSCLVLAYANAKRSALWHGYDFRTHARNVKYYLLNYVSLPDEYMFLKNRPAIGPYADGVARAELAWRTPSGLRLRLLIPLLVLVSAFVALRLQSRFMLGLLTLLGLHMVSHILTDGAEGARFVFDMEFAYYLLLGLVLNWVHLSWQRRRSQREICQPA
jgi:hypothetical protein